jgi:hypothetical protein
LPSKRAERGGTLRESGAFPLVGDRGSEELGPGVGGVRERARSWSPKKSSAAADESNKDTGNTSMGRSLHRFSMERKTDGSEGRITEKIAEKEKLGGTLRRFLGLRRASRQDDEGAAGTSQLSEEGWLRESGGQGKGKMPQRPTLRESFVSHDSPQRTAFRTPPSPPHPGTKVAGHSLRSSQDIYQEKRTRRDERERRRGYRSSDDYLAVSGINPRTGYPDDTPTASGTTSSSTTATEEIRRRVSLARKELQEALERREREVKEREMKKAEKRRRKEKRKQDREMRKRGSAKWRSEDGGWNMVMEPILSPIAGSTAASPRRGSLVHPNASPTRGRSPPP